MDYVLGFGLLLATASLIGEKISAIVTAAIKE